MSAAKRLIDPTRLATLLGSQQQQQLPVLTEKLVYKGWRDVIKRTVQFPDGRPVTFDVTVAPPAVLVLPWCTKTKTMTLLKEYCPGINRLGVFTVVAGLYEAKHKNAEECVRWETEEEAQLRGGELVPIMENESLLLPGAKYTGQKYLPYIVLDAEKVSDPRRVDDDELIQPIHGVTVDEALWLVTHGHVTSTSCLMVLLALNKLKNMHQIEAEASPG